MHSADLQHERNRPSLVLLHGWAAHAGYFDDLVAALDWPEVYVPDLPGHGKNKASSHAGSITQIARWLHDYVTENKLHKPVILGWSMGAMVALEYVKLFGDDAVSGVVIEDMTPRLINDADWQLGLSGGFSAAQNQKAVAMIADDWPRYVAGVSSRFFAQGAVQDTSMIWIHDDLLHNDSAIMAGLWQSISEQDYRALLPTIHCPVLVISGGKSQLYSGDTAQYFIRQLPIARLVVCHNSGHAPHLEETEKVAHAVDDFMLDLVAL